MNIKARLAQAPRNQKDNVAQEIIHSLSRSALKALSAEDVLRLFEALTQLRPRIVSQRDKAAVKVLASQTQFEKALFTPQLAVDSVKAHFLQSPVVQSHLSAKLVKGIYRVEDQRLSFLERMGIDGKTVGRGQLGQSAFTDVTSPNYLKSPFEQYAKCYFIAKQLNNPLQRVAQINMPPYSVTVPSNYSVVYPETSLEDFVVAGYLAIRIHKATKQGRTPEDTLKFAVALYHGMYKTVVSIQQQVNDIVNWAPIEAELINQNRQDAVDYINEATL
ncbi:hypothetical protein [Thaumasiovibrio subtropicus]|uniref:hypothetical protein n=1 Tax=Thaumasiovibrio subtropicus TaxID=1891207 RepID=UPI000B34C656|nr:hypothetical protein [Thaumasiovibrio subtropicus]